MSGDCPARASVLHEPAPGKVNLCLLVGRPRADGYHPLVSVVQSLTLADDVLLADAPARAKTDRVVCDGVAGENLAARALALFRAETAWDAPPRLITIRKRVPVAAGMGGGSADAAATLRLLARAARLQPDDPALARIAPRLGADVPSQLRPGRVLMSGVGEVIERLDAAPPPYGGFLVLPSPHALATPDVYRAFDELGLGRGTAELEEARVALANGAPVQPINDLEPAARHLLPAIDDALDAARAAGAPQAIVSGSGPTVVGLFPSAAAAQAAWDRCHWPGAQAVAPVSYSWAAA